MPVSVIRALKRITRNPCLNILVGLIFLATGLTEAWESLADDLAALKLGVHHGAILVGLLQATKAIPDLFESLEYLEEPSDPS